MATGKRYYWIKLKTSFMTSDAVDFLMGQPDGANYVVLYQMLCLKTINTGGKLERQIGEIIVPYDEAKIERDCKWFSIDTIHVALNLYKKLGLIYVDNNGVLCLTGHADLIGSETDYASQKRQQRIGKETLQELPEASVDNTMDNCVDTGVDSTVDSGVEIVHTEIEYRDRDKSIENRDRYKNIDNNKEFNLSISDDIDCRTNERQKVIDEWNSLGISPISRLTSGTNRYSMLNARLKEYGLDAVLQAIWNVRISSFLRGQNKDGWTITFDWFVKPNNFVKVLEGNYTDKEGQQRQNGRPMQESTPDRIARLMREGAFGE